MVKTLAIAEAITSYNALREQFNLRQTDSDQFFTEWFENLPELADFEKAALDRVKQRYADRRADGPLAEGTVMLLVAAPLLELAGFYDPPFKIRGEASVKIEVEDEEETKIFRGRIDALVFHSQFWVLVGEAKNTQFSAEITIPQCLAYMMAKSQPEKPSFGLVTNGGEFIFIKLSQQGQPQYDVSDVFSLAPRRNKLYEVFGILKRIGELMRQT